MRNQEKKRRKASLFAHEISWNCAGGEKKKREEKKGGPFPLFPQK